MYCMLLLLYPCQHPITSTYLTPPLPPNLHPSGPSPALTAIAQVFFFWVNKKLPDKGIACFKGLPVFLCALPQPYRAEHLIHHCVSHHCSCLQTIMLIAPTLNGTKFLWLERGDCFSSIALFTVTPCCLILIVSLPWTNEIESWNYCQCEYFKWNGIRFYWNHCNWGYTKSITPVIVMLPISPILQSRLVISVFLKVDNFVLLICSCCYVGP